MDAVSGSVRRYGRGDTVSLAACSVRENYHDDQLTVGWRSAVLLVVDWVAGEEWARQNMPTLEGVGMAPDDLSGEWQL